MGRSSLLAIVVAALAALAGMSAVVVSHETAATDETATSAVIAAPAGAASSDVANGRDAGGFPAASLEDRTYLYAGLDVDGLDLLENAGYQCVGIDPANTRIGAGSGNLGTDRYTHPATKKGDQLSELGAELYDCLLACLPADHGDWSPGALSAGQPCLNTQLSKLSKTWDSDVWVPVVDALIHDHPELEDTCHEGAHDAGKHALLVRNEPLAEALRRSTAACVSGFRHGMLDAVGFTKPSVDDLVELGGLCATLDDVAIDCFHGLGHAAWDASGDLDAAVRACAPLDSSAMRICSYGIVMRRYQRELALSERADVPALIEDALELCAAWPDLPTQDGASTLQGCWYGVAYQMWFPLAGGSDGTERIEDLGAVIEQITRACATAPRPDLVSVCEGEAGRYVASTSRWNTERALLLCDYVADIPRCRQTAADDVAATRAQRSIID